jgi:hypothetical protein
VRIEVEDYDDPPSLESSRVEVTRVAAAARLRVPFASGEAMYDLQVEPTPLPAAYPIGSAPAGWLNEEECSSAEGAQVRYGCESTSRRGHIA